MSVQPHEVSTTEFQAHFLSLVEEVEQERNPVIITKEGRPVAQLIPVETPPANRESGFGCMAGTITITGDIISPMDDIVWNAMQE